jgi:S1-C subfamily serine protease
MSSFLKDSMADELKQVAVREGDPDLIDKIADERVATNAHVVAEAEKRIAGKSAREGTIALVVAITGASPSKPRAWPAHLLSLDKRHDLAVLRVEGGPLPALALGNSDEVREGQRVAFTGFPIGNALGFVPVTHRGIVSAVTPNILPGGNAQRLNATAIRGLRDGAYNMFQLDGTAYPGNSGGPLFDADSGKVVGIINMVLVKRTKEAMLSHPSGISYAVPANYLRNLLAGSP